MNASNDLPSAQPLGRTSAAATSPWLLLCIEYLLILAGFLLLWPTTQSLLREWEDTDKTTYTHGYLIVLISFWLLLRNRRQLGLHRVGPSAPACIALAVASLAWLVALRSGIRTGEYLLLPGMMWLALWGALGKRVALVAAFALGYLYFAIPLWGSINDYLQSATVLAVDILLRLTGVAAYVQGNVVHLATGVFEVAGGCSGLHFFIVALALAALYGEVHRDRLRTRLQLLALAAVLAMITNWLRVYVIILAGYLTDMQHYLVQVEHYRFGWLVFAVMMAVFFFVALKMPASDHESAAAPALDPEPMSLRRGVVRGVALSMLAFSVGPLWSAAAPIRAGALPASDALLRVNPGGWIGPRSANALGWRPTFSSADVQQGGDYRSGSRIVQAFVAAYAWQTQGRELVRYDNLIVEEQAQILSTAQMQANGPVTELVVADDAGRQSVLWYSYRIDGVQTDRGLVAQLWYGVSSLARSPVSSVVALRSPCEPSCDSARDALREFSGTDWIGAAADKTRDVLR